MPNAAEQTRTHLQGLKEQAMQAVKEATQGGGVSQATNQLALTTLERGVQHLQQALQQQSAKIVEAEKQVGEMRAQIPAERQAWEQASQKKIDNSLGVVCENVASLPQQVWAKIEEHQGAWQQRILREVEARVARTQADPGLPPWGRGGPGRRASFGPADRGDSPRRSSTKFGCPPARGGWDRANAAKGKRGGESAATRRPPAEGWLFQADPPSQGIGSQGRAKAKKAREPRHSGVLHGYG